MSETLRKLGLDRGQLVHLLGFHALRSLLITAPVVNPVEEVVFLLVHQAVDLPVEPLKPIKLHHVKIDDRNAADFCP